MTPGGTSPAAGQTANDQISWWVWNLVSGARLSSWPQPRTRTPARIATRLAVAVALAVAAGVLADAARSGTVEWSTDGLSLVAADAYERGRARWPLLPHALWTAAAGALAAGGWQGTGWLLDRQHHRRWVLPLHDALRRDVWGTAAGKVRPGAWLLVPRDFADAPTGVRVRVPITIDPIGNDRPRIEAKVRERLPVGDVNAHWETTSHHCFLQMTAKAKLPARVFHTDAAVAAEVAKSEAGKPFLGMTAGNRPYWVDFTRETPHGLFSAGTGGGKSSGVKAIAAQEMHHGAGLVVIDAIKRKSHRWAKDPATKWRKPIPGVIYCRTIPEAHRALISLGGELARRQDASEELPDGVELDDPRIIVICEELNATMHRLEAHWRKIRSDPDQAGDWLGEVVSPAVQAYRDGLLMGRAERVNILAVAQMGTAKALGGGEARENYGLRALARFSEQARRMLIPTAGRQFRSSTKVGRWVVAQGDDAADVQVLLIEDGPARDLATSGVPSRLPFGHRPVPVADGRPALHVVRDGPVTAMSLRDLSTDQGSAAVAETFEALKRARYRPEEGFPQPAGRKGTTLLYDVGEVQRWSAERAEARQVDA